ncbi:IS66 family transposase [Deinococcus rubellus]|uniref:IS66 family transposase n=1 Tax=Deinococcus rubellus TaxID=1889240 RepID=UPI0031E5E4EF
MGVCTREEYAQQGEFLTLRLNALLNRAPLKSKANERLRVGVLKQNVLDRVWQFLKDPDIPPTNNAAERSLRTVVMARKVSQCSKNVLGAQTYMRIKSTVETARLRGQDPVAVLTSLNRLYVGFGTETRQTVHAAWSKRPLISIDRRVTPVLTDRPNNCLNPGVRMSKLGAGQNPVPHDHSGGAPVCQTRRSSVLMSRKPASMSRCCPAVKSSPSTTPPLDSPNC